MTRTIEPDPGVWTESRLQAMATVFDRVRDPRDWMAPIESVIPASARGVVEQAVVMFTSTEPTFAETADRPDRLVVRAPGYRRGPLGGTSGQACD